MGGWMPEKQFWRSGGEKCFSLDIPFYRTFPPLRRRRVFGYISNVSTVEPRVTSLNGLTRPFYIMVTLRSVTHILNENNRVVRHKQSFNGVAIGRDECTLIAACEVKKEIPAKE